MARKALYNGSTHRADSAWIRAHVTVIEMARGTSTSSVVGQWIPAINWIGKYDSEWLVGDLVAGLTVSAVVIPLPVPCPSPRNCAVIERTPLGHCAFVRLGSFAAPGGAYFAEPGA